MYVYIDGKGQAAGASKREREREKGGGPRGGRVPLAPCSSSSTRSPRCCSISLALFVRRGNYADCRLGPDGPLMEAELRDSCARRRAGFLLPPWYAHLCANDARDAHRYIYIRACAQDRARSMFVLVSLLVRFGIRDLLYARA